MLIPFGVFSAGAGSGAAAGAYELISTTVLTTNASSILFSSIPNTYKHLQIRSSIVSSGNGATYTMNQNSIAGSVYANHGIFNDGSVLVPFGQTSQTGIFMFARYIGMSTTKPLVSIIDIVDYASTNKNKTIRSLHGIATDELTIHSGFTASTAAVTQLELASSAPFAATSRFSLYGIKG